MYKKSVPELFLASPSGFSAYVAGAICLNRNHTSRQVNNIHIYTFPSGAVRPLHFYFKLSLYFGEFYSVVTEIIQFHHSPGTAYISLVRQPYQPEHIMIHRKMYHYEGGSQSSGRVKGVIQEYPEWSLLLRLFPEIQAASTAAAPLIGNAATIKPLPQRTRLAGWQSAAKG